MLRFLFTAAIVAALFSTAGTASAAGPYSGCQSAHRGGPLRNLFGGLADRIQARRGGGCQAAAAAPATGAAPVYHATPTGGAACAAGVCYPAPRR